MDDELFSRPEPEDQTLFGDDALDYMVYKEIHDNKPPPRRPGCLFTMLLLPFYILMKLVTKR